MRTAAKAQLFTDVGQTDAVGLVRTQILEWISDKYSYRDGAYTVKKSGERGIVNIGEIEANEQSTRLRFNTSEVVSGGSLRTFVDIIQTNSQTWLLYRLMIGTGSGLITPVNAPIRLSRYFKKIVDLDLKWRIAPDSDRVFGFSFGVDSTNFATFKELLLSRARRLPIICVSDHAESALPTDAATRLADTFKGLAHVCILNNDASWQLTLTLGKEWSCFNGATRVYWPFLLQDQSPFKHPLFTQSFLHVGDSRNTPYFILENSLAKIIFDASCYLSESAVFSDFDKNILNAEIEKARAHAQDTNDYTRLEELYAKENDRLSGDNKQLADENERLRWENEQLSIVIREGSSSAKPEVGETGFVPSTLHEAVEQAKIAFKNDILFGDDVDDQAHRAREDAGPPDKVYKFLESLALLANEHRRLKGVLGCTVVQWLANKGVPCSGESETKKKGGLHKWTVNGIQTPFELHLKPNEATSPDRCIRIYFDVRNFDPRIVIGFVGCKADLD